LAISFLVSPLELLPEHIGLAATDATLLKQWYEKVLDAKPLVQLQSDPPAYLLELPGGLLVEIYSARRVVGEMSDNTVAGWRHLALKVASLDQARDLLAKRGVIFSEGEKPAGGGGRVLFFKDPEGNLFHLVERLPAGLKI
jgi:glyoxylase I family protein